MSIKLSIGILVALFSAVNTLSVSMVLLPISINDVSNPVAAPPINVAIWVLPNTKSFPLSKICGKILTICWLLNANSKMFFKLITNKYCNDTHVTDKDDDVFPCAHSYKFLGQSAAVDVD